MVLPGICAYYIMGNEDTFRSMNLAGEITVADDAYPWLIRNFTPTGIKGLSFAALTAAIISSLASMFNSTSTLFTMDIYKKYINKDAKDKQLVNVGRITSVCALIIALIAVKPLLGGLDQAFQYIQEYSGFIYPGIITVFGLGLFWKRASSRAAVWTAILTIPLGVLFKVFFPEIPFQFRAGNIFIILVTFFIYMSYYDKNYVKAEPVSHKDKLQMYWWARFLGIVGLFFIFLAGTLMVVDSTNAVENPNESFADYMGDIGVGAFVFFGVLVGVNAVWLRSNYRDGIKDPKALPVRLDLFHTSRAYNLGALGICLITLVLYALLW